jgi:hypothetical protein
MNEDRKHFLMLLALNKVNATIGRAVMDRIKKEIDPAAAPLWIDAHGVGVFFTTDLPTWQIWAKAFPEKAQREDQMTMKDLLIVQVGPGWYAGDPSTKYGGWLNARFPRS